MTRSSKVTVGWLALAVMIGGTLHAQATYTWVAASAPPANVVTAPDGGHKAVCRGTGQYGRPWAGFWDGTTCLGSYSGNIMPAGTGVQFLTVASGTAQWVSGTGKIIPGDIGTVPSNTINAGSTYSNLPQVLCARQGYVGWVNQNSCSLGAAGTSAQQNATVLVGAMYTPPVYAWVAGSAPPANVVMAPDGGKPVCRGTGQYGRPWAGFWDGTTCLGSYSGNIMPATTGVQFLTVTAGAATWVSGTGKIIPGDIGTVPSNTINAGNTYTNLPQVLCARQGYVGWVNQNSCSLGAKGTSAQQNATVLVGSAR